MAFNVICKNYWEVKVEYLLKRFNFPKPVSYLTTKYANGEYFYNGNPIGNFYVEKRNKSVRIIQEEPESQNIENFGLDR
jgi:hypothetical protein